MKYRAPKTESMFFQLLLLKNRARLLIETSAKRAQDRFISILQKISVLKLPQMLLLLTEKARH